MPMELWKSICDWATVVFIALTVFSGAGALITGDIIGKRQEGRLRQFEQDLTDSKIKLANAQQSASEAALALVKFKEPRTLSPEQQNKLIAVLKPFAGQNFAFAVFPDPEPLALLRLLDTLAKSAGWKRVPSQIERAGGVKVDAAGETAATIFDSGIDAYIAPDDMASVPAQSAFCSALVAAGIHCETHRTPQLAGKAPLAITISIGKKP
ncbi:MAG TPA: hypothetical protein VNW47_14460 [Terriglobales bacterium]|nr:hypothetical protein [Terriglobales bacterium]